MAQPSQDTPSVGVAPPKTTRTEEDALPTSGGNGEEECKDGKLERKKPEEPPYPILLTLQVILMSFVLVQFHFYWGSNGNDGLPGVFDPSCSGVGKRKKLMLFWYLPLYLGAILIPTVFYRISGLVGCTAFIAWILALLLVTARAELWPGYWNDNVRGQRRQYPDGVLKPVDYNVTVYNPSTEIRWFKSNGWPRMANVQYVVLQTIKHLQEISLVLFICDTAGSGVLSGGEGGRIDTSPWGPDQARQVIGNIYFIFNPSFQGQDVAVAFDLNTDSFSDYQKDALPVLYRLQGWLGIAFVLIWSFVFAHYACNPDDVLVKSAKCEPGGLKGFRVFRLLLDIFGTILFLPLVRTLTQTPLVCVDKDLGTGHYFILGDNVCWTEEHAVMAVFSMLMLISYFPIGAGSCIINSCCDGAFENEDLDVKMIPTLTVAKNISFAAIYMLHLVVLKAQTTWLNIVFCSFYILVCCFFAWGYIRLKSRDGTCQAPLGCPNSELKLGDQGVFNACSVYSVCIFHFLFFVVKVYAGVVALIVSAVPAESLPENNSFLLIPIIAIIVFGFPLRGLIGRLLGLGRPARVVKQEEPKGLLSAEKEDSRPNLVSFAVTTIPASLETSDTVLDQEHSVSLRQGTTLMLAGASQGLHPRSSAWAVSAAHEQRPADPSQWAWWCGVEVVDC